MAKKKVLASLVILLLLLGSYYLYNSSRDNVFKYNGYKIYQTAPVVYDIEVFLKNDQNPHYISVRYDPRTLDYIEIEENIKERVIREEVFITLTPELTSESVIAAAEIAKIIGNQFLFNLPVKTALTYKKENIPVKTCSDVTTTESIIVLRLGEESKVFKQEECIIVEGKTEEEIIKASTKFILDLLGIAKK
ncbi:MAG: hypothetical protein AABW58_01265 [Nanoarchaeota archaeon]